MFSSGAGVEVIENKGFMSARVYLPWTYVVSCKETFTAFGGIKTVFFQFHILILRNECSPFENTYLTSSAAIFRTKREGYSGTGPSILMTTLRDRMELSPLSI